jgi:FMN-dependent NADH-azoreductase
MHNMKKILHILSSPQGEGSTTKKLGSAIVSEIVTKYPGSVVTELDLVSVPFPHLDQRQIGAWMTPVADRSPDQMKAIKLSDEAVAAMQDADIYVIGAPFYNFAIPSTLKAFLDHVARPGVTFRYSEQGIPEGLLLNKKAYVATASSGVYSDGPFQSFDFVSPYLRFILGFLGVSDVSIFRVEGLKMPGVKETAYENALQSIRID